MDRNTDLPVVQPTSPRRSSGAEAIADGPNDGAALNRRLRKMYREKKLAQGITVPDSPPPQPPPLTRTTSNDPLVRNLLTAGGTVVYEKMHMWLIKHACGTRITKYRRDGPKPAEADAMRFVAQHTTIPVPEVYDAGPRHITMAFVEGKTAQEGWDGLSEQDRARAVAQLRDCVRQMRALKSPDGAVCGFGGHPRVDFRRYCGREGGPFATEAEYNDWLVADLFGTFEATAPMVRSQMRSDHDIVFSHGDLHDVNIMVRPGEGVVAVLDWELAGWYPEYADFFKPLRAPYPYRGYYEALFDIYPKHYEAEYPVDVVLSMCSRS